MTYTHNGTRILLYNKYKMLALNMFKWNGLPPTLQSRHIEIALYETGYSCIYNHEDLGVIGLLATPVTFNVHNEGIKFRIYGLGFQRIVTKKDDRVIAIIQNNDLGLPTKSYVDEYSHRMTDVEMSIRENINQQKFPYIIECSKTNKLSLEKVMEQKASGKPVIYANKNLGLENLNVLGLNTPYVVDRLQEYKYELEREILTFLGINNTYEKSERLLSNEVDSNNDYISRMNEIMFRCRENVIEILQQKISPNISIEKTVNTLSVKEHDNE